MYKLLLALLMAVCLSGCGVKKADNPAPLKTRPPALVSTAAAGEGVLVEYLNATGHVRALQRAMVNTKITGRVDRVMVREGDRVAAGQPLVYLDDRDLRAQVQQAEAAVALARARALQQENGTSLTSAQVNTDIGRAQQTVLQMQAQAERDRAELDDARTDLRRKQDLFKQDAIPQTQLDTARLRFRQAEQAVRASHTQIEAAQHTLRLAHAGTSQNTMHQDEVRAARAAVAEAEASLQSARVSLDYAVLRAPISGTITKRDTEPGQTVSTQQSNPLLVIVDNARLELVVTADERYSPYLGTGTSVAISSAVVNDKVSGRILSAVPSSDASSHTVLVRITLGSGGSHLLDGVYAQARFQLREHRGVLVPLSAVQTRSDATYVMVMQDGKAHKRDVRVEYQDSANAVIKSGLKVGEKVVSVGAEGLEDGQAISTGHS